MRARQYFTDQFLMRKNWTP